MQGHHVGYNGKEGRWYPHLLYTRPPRRVQLVQLPQITLPFVCKATMPGTIGGLPPIHIYREITLQFVARPPHFLYHFPPCILFYQLSCYND